MQIKNGTIEDVIKNLDLIRSKIPQKADITAEEVFDRLSTRNHGVKLGLKDKEVCGIIVWYENDGDLYLWLGAMKSTGNRIGSKIFESIEAETDYTRWFAKTAVDNIPAKSFLEKYGFKEYCREEDIVYMERIKIVGRLKNAEEK